MFYKDPICKSYTGSTFLLGGVLVLVAGWLETILEESRVGFGRKTLTILEECWDEFGSPL